MNRFNCHKEEEVEMNEYCFADEELSEYSTFAIDGISGHVVSAAAVESKDTLTINTLRLPKLEIIVQEPISQLNEVTLEEQPTKMPLRSKLLQTWRKICQPSRKESPTVALNNSPSTTPKASKQSSNWKNLFRRFKSSRRIHPTPQVLKCRRHSRGNLKKKTKNRKVTEYLCACRSCALKFEQIDRELAASTDFVSKRHLLHTRRVLQAYCTFAEAFGFAHRFIASVRRFLVEADMDEDLAFNQLIKQVSQLRVNRYLCSCGSCPDYPAIESDLRSAAYVSGRRGAIGRVLKAFCTYNEHIGYHRGMISLAESCLESVDGDENRAFAAFSLFVQDRFLQLEKTRVQV